MDFISRINARDLYKFQLHLAYHSTQGWSAIVLGILSLVMCYRTYGNVSVSYSGLYLIFGLIFIVYVPVTLKLQSDKRYKMQGVLRQEFNFSLDEEGIKLRIEDQNEELPWNRVYLLKTTKDYIYVFSGKAYAYIIPKRCVKDQCDEILSYMKANLPAERIKVKK